ncbi:hypothetical protein Pav631_3442, partial [Pseudomonas avellanae BPIC 631]
MRDTTRSGATPFSCLTGISCSVTARYGKDVRQTSALSELEVGNQRIKRRGQTRQFLTRRAGLVGTGGALGRKVLNVDQVAIHLTRHLGLLFGRGGDDQVTLVDRGDTQGDFFQRGTGTQGQFLSIGGQRQAFAHRRYSAVGTGLHGADHAFDFHSGRLSAVRQRANLIGYHRKTAPLLTGPCSFDGGVERQQVG